MELTRRAALAATGVGGVVGLTGCLGATRGATVEQRETLTRRVDGATALTVDGVDGDVSVRTHDDDGVRVDAVGRGPSGRAVERAAVETRRDDGTLAVEAVVPDGVDVDLDLDVRVPAGLAVARAGTGTGDVTVRGTTGDAVLAATNGDVTAEDVDGFVTLRTANGAVSAAGTAGFDGANAVNGDVDVEVRAVRADAAARTTNGEVRVAVADTLDADVAATATNGPLAVDGVSLADATTRRDRVAGRLNDGGPRLGARAATGAVSLRPLDA